MSLMKWNGCQVHVLPGRVRVRLPGLRGNPAAAQRLTAGLRRIPGVQMVAPNPVTGSILVLFDPTLLPLARLRDCLGLPEPARTPAPAHAPAARPLPSTQQARTQVLLTGAALAAVVAKRWLVGPSRLSSMWGTYDLAGIVTLVASYPFLRRGLQDSLAHRRLDGDLAIGLAGLGATLLRENVLGLSVLFLSNVSHLLFAQTLQTYRESTAALRPHAATLPLAARPRHDQLLAERARQRATTWGTWAVGGAVLAGLLTGDWRRGLATLVAAAPAAVNLAHALPLAAATTTAARRGILSRDGHALGAAGQVDVVVLSDLHRLTPGVAGAAAIPPAVRTAVADLRRCGVKHIGLMVSLADYACAQALGRALQLDFVVPAPTPAAAAAFVAALQARGHLVAVLGSQASDSAPLAAADVGLASGRGAWRAQVAADAIVAPDDLGSLVDFVRLGRYTQRVVRSNHNMAVGMNVVGLVLAATGVAGPLTASLWHNLTSLTVVGNSLRLLRV